MRDYAQTIAPARHRLSEKDAAYPHVSNRFNCSNVFSEVIIGSSKLHCTNYYRILFTLSPHIRWCGWLLRMKYWRQLEWKCTQHSRTQQETTTTTKKQVLKLLSFHHNVVMHETAYYNLWQRPAWPLPSLYPAVCSPPAIICTLVWFSLTCVATAAALSLPELLLPLLLLHHTTFQPITNPSRYKAVLLRVAHDNHRHGCAVSHLLFTVTWWDNWKQQQ